MSRLDKKINKYNREKKLLDLDKENQKLWDAKYDLGWINLETPIFDGYEKKLILREDYTRRSDHKIYEDLLSIVGHSVYCRNKSFTSKNWKTKKLEPIKVLPKSLSNSEFKKKVPERLKRYFYRYFDTGYGYKYTLKETYMFIESKRYKHYKTRVRLIDPEIESRISEVQDQLYGNPKNIGKLDNLLGIRRHNDWDFNSLKYPKFNYKDIINDIEI